MKYKLLSILLLSSYAIGVEKDIFIYNDGSSLQNISGDVRSLENYVTIDDNRLLMNHMSSYIDFNSIYVESNNEVFIKVEKKEQVKRYKDILDKYLDSTTEPSVIYQNTITGEPKNGRLIGSLEGKFLVRLNEGAFNSGDVILTSAENILVKSHEINNLLKDANSDYIAYFENSLSNGDVLNLNYKTTNNTFNWNYQYDLFLNEDSINLTLFSTIENNDDIDYENYNFYLVSGDTGQKSMPQTRNLSMDMMVESRAMSAPNMNDSTLSLDNLHISPLTTLESLYSKTKNKVIIGQLEKLTYNGNVVINDRINERNIRNMVNNSDRLSNRYEIEIKYEENKEQLNTILPEGNVTFFEEKEELNNLPIVIFNDRLQHSNREDIKFSLPEKNVLQTHRSIKDVSTKNLSFNSEYFVYNNFTVVYDIENRGDNDKSIIIKTDFGYQSFNYNTRNKLNIENYQYEIKQVKINGNIVDRDEELIRDITLETDDNKKYIVEVEYIYTEI